MTIAGGSCHAGNVIKQPMFLEGISVARTPLALPLMQIPHTACAPLEVMVELKQNSCGLIKLQGVLLASQSCL